MRHKNSVELYRYWNELRGSAAAPARSSIAPAALGRLLPSVFLLDMAEDGDIVFRLAGSKLGTLHCAELRGLPIGELFAPDDRNRMQKILDAVHKENGVVVLDIAASRPGGDSVDMEMALFPLADEKTPILGIATTFSVPDWAGLVPAVLEVRGLRYLNADARHAFLQSRPSIPVLRRQTDDHNAKNPNLQVIRGKGEIGVSRPIRAFRVVDGGKT